MVVSRFFRYADSCKAKGNFSFAGNLMVFQDSVRSFKVADSYDMVVERPTSHFSDV